jgi:hypothetical protein
LEVAAVVFAATARCTLVATITQKPPKAKKKHHKKSTPSNDFSNWFLFPLITEEPQ